jgi:membrane-associated phospholipid phosphatase
MSAVNGFDLAILHGLNALVGRSANFDKGIEFLADTELKGAIFVSVYWWYWFRVTDTATITRTREHVLRTLCAGIVAIFAARVLALTLPFRLRPRFEPALHLVLPDPGATGLMDWSSFPSDHAVMFSALAVGLCFISWRTGLLALLYTAFIICLPRICLGIHYPTDIIAGLALGALIGYCMNVAPVCKNLTRRALRWESTSPGSFYCALFLVIFEFSTMFNSLRAVALHAARFVVPLAGAH